VLVKVCVDEKECVCMCVCVCERERERVNEREVKFTFAAISSNILHLFSTNIAELSFNQSPLNHVGNWIL